jgi:hypothetical protein
VYTMSSSLIPDRRLFCHQRLYTRRQNFLSSNLRNVNEVEGAHKDGKVMQNSTRRERSDCQGMRANSHIFQGGRELVPSPKCCEATLHSHAWVCGDIIFAAISES